MFKCSSCSLQSGEDGCPRTAGSVHARPSTALRQVAMSSKVKGQSSPGAALAAVAADGLTVAVALLDDHADVGLHELGDVHDLQRGESSYRSAV